MSSIIHKLALKVPQVKLLYENKNKLEEENNSLHSRLALADEILNQKKCEICGNQVIRYLPLGDYFFEESRRYGYPIDDNNPETLNFSEYVCPHCGAADRERLYALYMKELFGENHPDSKFVFLDIAPSPPLANFVKETWNVDYRSLDLYMDGVDYHDDLTNIISLQENTVDFFVCSHVLEHIENDRKAIAELYRILKPGGYGIMMVPLMMNINTTDEDATVDSSEKWRRFAQGDHVRLYAKSDFVARLSGAGFNIEQLGRAHFGLEPFFRNGLTQTSMLYVVAK
jgi:SAM-dependent methyltransferase